MRGTVWSVMVVVGLVAACGPHAPPTERDYVALGAIPASFVVGCSGPSDCTTAASGLACTQSLGCDTSVTPHVCKFAVASTTSCPCFQNDLRWCPGTNYQQVQFCAKTGPTSTQWQVDGTGANACGPADQACQTGNVDCPTGVSRSAVDPSTLTWVAGATCTPRPACPHIGDVQQCPTGDPRCPVGNRTYGAQPSPSVTGWSDCVKVNCPAPPPDAAPPPAPPPDAAPPPPTCTSTSVATNVQLGDKLKGFDATATTCSNDGPGTITINVSNQATSGSLWCQFVIEDHGTVWDSGRLGQQGSNSTSLSVQQYAGHTLHVALWTPGFACAPGSGGGAADFFVPDKGNVVVNAVCVQAGHC